MDYPLEELFALIDQRLTQTSQRVRADNLSAGEMASLTGTHIFYLHAIRGLEKPTLTGLAEAFRVTKPSVTAVVNRLIEMGYLEKQQSGKDRRVFYLHLTEAGQRVVRIKEQTFHLFADQIRAHLADGEARELERLLSKALQAPDQENNR